jgi:diaminohydroxyphosphoribosylaminopyrimidine deaminase / 5-amino-6-(5-phosphoribosylamino)uracil reductase
MSFHPPPTNESISLARGDVLSWMRLAVDEGKKSEDEPDRSGPAPKVGVVVVGRDGKMLGSSYRGRDNPGHHAEYGLLEGQLAGVDLNGATVFTTLEPCSRRGKGKTPCARWLIERGVSTVYIGTYDPFPTIYRLGWKMLSDAGVRLCDFTEDLRNEIRHDNKAFMDSLSYSVGSEGIASFDFTLNDGVFPVIADEVIFDTKWGERGSNSVYAYGNVGEVALARFATKFEDIDDPGAHDWSSHAAPVGEGAIVMFKRPGGYLLARVDNVHGGPQWGSEHCELRFTYQVRHLPDSINE